MKVAMSSLFSWFHAARKEEIYIMALFWEKPSDNLIRLGRPKPLSGDITILLLFWRKVTRWPFKSYELEDEA